MSWKKNFAARIRLDQLPDIGAFKLNDVPEPLGKGKFRLILLLKNGDRRMLTTFESTIGDMIVAGDGWIEAYLVKVGDKQYTNFRAVK